MATAKIKPASEVRIHGVGGSPGPKLLGYADLKDTQVVEKDRLIVTRRRVPDSGVVGFDWGAVNSASTFQAPWVFLLPFTLLNAAGWMIGRGPRGEVGKTEAERTNHLDEQISRGLITLVGLTLTALTTLWCFDVIVGYIGFQLGPLALTARKSSLPVQDVGSWLGVVLIVVLMAVFGWLAGRTIHEDASSTPSDAEPLRLRASIWTARAGTHVVVFAVTIAWGAQRLAHALGNPADPERLDLSLGLLWLAALQTVLLLVLAVTAWIVPAARGRLGGPALPAAVLACVLSGALLSGGGLWVAKELPKVLKVPNAGELRPGREFAFIDAYAWMAIWFVVVALVLLAQRQRSKRATTVDHDPVHPRLEVATARTRTVAGFVHKVKGLTLWLMIPGGAAFLVAAGQHLDAWLPPAVDQDPSFDAAMFRLAAWGLPAASVFLALRVRKAVTDGTVRRFFGQAWDVLCYFPRHYHPLAVRSYTPLVVPRFREVIASAIESDGDRVVVSAHSQGTIVAVEALDEMAPEQLARIAFVTYGSPVGTLHGRCFPSWFNDHRVAHLAGRLGGGWSNLYRQTDPIGGSIPGLDLWIPNGPDGVPARFGANRELDDPACIPNPVASPPEAAPLELDRPIDEDIVGHSWYLREWELKAWVAALRSEAPWQGPRWPNPLSPPSSP